MPGVVYSVVSVVTVIGLLTVFSMVFGDVLHNVIAVFSIGRVVGIMLCVL
jgi:hypothetical protein